MKWGVRRDRSRVRKSSSEHKRVAELRKKKPHQLTNKQLKTINERKNLEQNYRRLNPSRVAMGAAAVGAMLGIASRGINAYNMLNSPAGKAAVRAGKLAMKHRRKTKRFSGYQQLTLF